MSIIPNLLVTGILACLVSLMYLLCATRFVERKHAGQVLILLAIAMLLAGGGMFPPVIGIFTGVLATRINHSVAATRTRPVADVCIRLGKAWPWCFAACLIGWLLLFPGANLLGYFFGVNDPNLTTSLIAFALGSLLLTVVAGLMHDRFELTVSRRAA